MLRPGRLVVQVEWHICASGLGCPLLAQRPRARVAHLCQRHPVRQSYAHSQHVANLARREALIGELGDGITALGNVHAHVAAGSSATGLACAERHLSKVPPRASLGEASREFSVR